MIKLTDILNEDENPCWKGYKQIGMKKKGGKEVPNCVPESVVKLKESTHEELSSSERLELYKLYSRAMKAMPQSPKQKKIKQQINKLRTKAGMKPLRENFLEFNITEGSLTISIANIVRELFPKEFFHAYKPQDVEKMKATISDLVKTLNRFYKQQNVKVRFTDTDFKYKMYSKD
jgi:hypothetical protein